MNPLDQITTEQILSFDELKTPYGLTGRFYDAKGEAASTIYNLSVYAQDRLLSGIGGIGKLIDIALSQKELTKPDIEAIQSVNSMLPVLTELMRGIETTAYSTAYEATKYDDDNSIDNLTEDQTAHILMPDGTKLRVSSEGL